MARSLENKTNVEAPDSDYPYGRIRDKTSLIPGTPFNEQVYGDIHQFFAKMFAESGLVYNELPDNDYSGFQYFEALKKIIGLDSGWLNSGYVAADDIASVSVPVQYRKIGNRVRIKGSVITNATILGGTTITLFTLPVGFRPVYSHEFPVIAAATADNLLCGGVVFNTGEVAIFLNSPENDYGDHIIYLDNMEFLID
jgi:hypothetical protein